MMPVVTQGTALADADDAPRLTDLTDCGGCAAKLGADLLAKALRGLGAMAPEALVAGLDPPDDAAAYVVSPDLAILGTLDFFPPLVDDPRTFGEIAAANAVSDVFAMGGRVLFALSIASFPDGFPEHALRAVLDGASEVVHEAGGTLAGGHTIRDDEPKYGLAVIGAAHPERLMRKGGSAPGDRLILTKPLGSGLLVSGRRSGQTRDDWLASAVVSMRGLNRAASEVLLAHGVRGATDVTGFGLIGHAAEMARAAGLRFVIDAAALPALPGALDVAERGMETGGAGHNRRSVSDIYERGPRVDLSREVLAFDPQTSGGLLAAVPAAHLEETVADLAARGVEATVIGRVEAAAGAGLALV
jgi:selenide,water dikinase